MVRNSNHFRTESKDWIAKK